MAIDYRLGLRLAGGGGGNVATKQEANFEAINALDFLPGNPIKKFETITKMTGRVMLALGDHANKKKLEKEILQVLASPPTMTREAYAYMSSSSMPPANTCRISFFNFFLFAGSPKPT
jgi:hypothetical protein